MVTENIDFSRVGGQLSSSGHQSPKSVRTQYILIAGNHSNASVNVLRSILLASSLTLLTNQHNTAFKLHNDLNISTVSDNELQYRLSVDITMQKMTDFSHFACNF